MIVAMYILYMYIFFMKRRSPTTGSLVWHLAMKWRSEVDRAIAHLGLTHAEYSVMATLHAVSENGRTPSQRQLADYAGLQQIYVSKLARALETSGHIRREPDSEDSRAFRLNLTVSGRDTIVAARSIVEALDRRLTAPIGGPEGERTRELTATLSLLLSQAPSSTQEESP